MIINLSKDDFDFANANELNVPVNIYVYVVDANMLYSRPELAEYAGWWLAKASNYMPRKHHVTFQSYCAVSPSRGELVAYIQKHVRPLYQYALRAIDDQPDEDGYSSLDYWGCLCTTTC